MKLIKRIAFGSAGLLVLMMMLATFLEKIQGTDTAWSVIYGSSVFTTIWGIMTICAFAYLIHRKLQRDFFTFLLHISFLIILTGALTTRLCGKQGSIHLRMNDAPASTFITSGQNKEPLPFQAQLHDFRLVIINAENVQLHLVGERPFIPSGTEDSRSRRIVHSPLDASLLAA